MDPKELKNKGKKKRAEDEECMEIDSEDEIKFDEIKNTKKKRSDSIVSVFLRVNRIMKN